MAFSAAARDSQMVDMNITPLVDVMLVLLVIFMIAAPAMTRSLAVTLPQRTQNPPAPVESVKLDISAGDVYALDGTPLGRPELSRRLAALAQASNKPLVVEISANPDAEYESVAQALATARNAGVENLVFVSR